MQNVPSSGNVLDAEAMLQITFSSMEAVPGMTTAAGLLQQHSQWPFGSAADMQSYLHSSMR